MAASQQEILRQIQQQQRQLSRESRVSRSSSSSSSDSTVVADSAYDIPDAGVVASALMNKAWTLSDLTPVRRLGNGRFGPVVAATLGESHPPVTAVAQASCRHILNSVFPDLQKKTIFSINFHAGAALGFWISHSLDVHGTGAGVRIVIFYEIPVFSLHNVLLVIP